MDPPTPFFGSKISLISKSKIRYEGFLYNIDPNDSTIALAKVKSFGTEDRSVDVPVPPRDDVFQLIIFRASDIQDLNVEDPNGVLPAPGLQDPAIVQAHPTSTSTSFPSSLPAQSQAQSSLGATVPTTSGQSINQQNRSKLQQSSNEPVVSSQEAKANKLVANQPQQNQQSGNNKQPFNRAVVRGNNAPNAGQQLTNKPRFGQDQQDSRNIPGGNNNQPRRQFPNQVGPQNNFQQRNGGNPFNLNFRQNGGFNPNYRNNNTFGNNGGYQANRRPNFNRPSNQGYPQSRPNPSGVPHVGAKTAFNLPLPDTEFDFEKAQTDFKILEEQLAGLKMGSSGEDGDNAAGDEKESQSLPTTTSEENTEEHEVVSPKYNKTKSFFDAISCEALEREKGPHQRVDWKIERKLNRETFGVVNTPRRVVNYRRGGGRPFHQNHYQGGGGGGGYRGNNPRFGGHQGGFQQRNNQHRPNFVQRSQQQPNQNRQQSNGVSTSGQPQQQQQQQPKTLASVVAAGNKNAANTILAAVNGTA